MQTYTHTVFAQIQTYAVDVGPAVHNLVHAEVAYASLDFEVAASSASIHAPSVQTEHLALASTETDQTVSPAWLSGDVTYTSQYIIRVETQSSEAVFSACAELPALSQEAEPMEEAAVSIYREPEATSPACGWQRISQSTGRMARQRRRRPLMHQGYSQSRRYVHAAVGPPLGPTRARHRAQSP
jgi:hypothetical protein